LKNSPFVTFFRVAAFSSEFLSLFSLSVTVNAFE